MTDVFESKRVLVCGRSVKWSGFTLIELMVTLAVLAIALSVAIPSFSDMTLRSKLRTYSSNLTSAALLARSEAINRNAQVTMCASSNGTSCTDTWAQGWIVLHGTTVLHRQQAIATDYRVSSGGVSSIVFQPSGVGATFATLDICRATPTVGAQGRRVTVSATGRTSVTEIAVTSCSSS